MKKKSESILNKVIFLFITYTIVYWFTAFFGDLYFMEQQQGTFYKSCYVFNEKLFFIMDFLAYIKLHSVIGSLGLIFTGIIIMSSISVLILHFFYILLKRFYLNSNNKRNF